jgi:hypothetical protein
VSSLWVEKADYAWIKNITLGYTLPKSIAGVIQTARVYGSIQNAFLFTSYPGNPEVTNYGNTADPRKAGPLVPGVDYSSYPVPRVFTIGTNLTF